MIRWTRNESGHLISSCRRFTIGKHDGRKDNPWWLRATGVVLRLQWGESDYVTGPSIKAMKEIAERSISNRRPWATVETVNLAPNEETDDELDGDE